MNINKLVFATFVFIAFECSYAKHDYKVLIPAYKFYIREHMNGHHHNREILADYLYALHFPDTFHIIQKELADWAWHEYISSSITGGSPDNLSATSKAIFKGALKYMIEQDPTSENDAEYRDVYDTIYQWVGNVKKCRVTQFEKRLKKFAKKHLEGASR